MGLQMFIRYLWLSMSRAACCKPRQILPRLLDPGRWGEQPSGDSFAATTERASVSPTKNKEIPKLVLGTLFPESAVAVECDTVLWKVWAEIYLST